MQKSKRAASVSIASSKALGAVNEAEDEREVVDTFHDALTDVRSATYVQGRVWTSTKAGQIVVRDPRSRVLAMVDETERCGYPGCMTVVDNTVWVGYSSGIIKAYSASTIREAPGGEFKRHSGAVHSIVKAGARVFSASADFQILEWTKDFAFVRQLSGHAGGVRSLAVKGSFLLSGSDDGTLRCWNIETGDPLKRVHAHQKGTRVVTSHSDYVWTGGEDGVIQVWDGATFELVATLEEHDGPVTCILAVDNEMWTGSNDRTLCVWSVSDYKLKRRTINHSNFITCIVKVVAHREVSEVWTAGADKTIHVWGWGSPFDSDECQRLREDLSMAQDAFKEQHNALYTKYLKMEGTKDAHIADLNKTIAGQAEDLIRCGDIQADIKKVLGKEHELEDKATEAFKGKQKDLLAALEQLRNSEREAAVKIESLSVTAAQIPQLEEELERARDKRTQMAHQLNKKEAELDAIKLRHMQDSAEAESYKRNTSQDLNELRACIASRDERIKKQNKDLEKRGEELAESEEGRIAALEKIDRLTNELALGNSETHTLKTGNERLEKRLKHLDGAFNQQQQLHESMARSQSAPLSEEHEKLMDTAGQLEADKKILKVKVKELEAQCKQLRELNNKASRGGSVSSGSVEAEDESHVAELERCLFETEEKLSASETDRLEIMKHFSKVQELLAEDTKEVRAWQEEVHTALEFVSPARTEVTLREILVEYKSSQDFLLCLEEAAKAGDAKSVLTLLGERTDVSQLSLFGPVDEERMRDDIAREYDIMLEDMRKEVDTLRQSTDSKSKTAEWVETIAPSPPPPPVPELSIATLNFQNRLQAADKARQEAEREVEELRNKLEATSPDPRGLSEVSRDTEIEALKAKLQLSMETREASRSEMETLSTRLRELENEAFKNEQARESSIQQQLHAAEIEVQELQEQVDVLTSKLTNASDADERLEEELKIREDGMKVLSDQLEKSAPLIEEMREVAAKSSKDLRKKERECEQLRTALDEFVEEREKLFTVNKELKKALTTETARCNELQASMEDAEMQLLEQEQGASEMRELKREVKKEANAALEARQKLEDAEADIEELKKQLEINARKRGEVLELKRKLEEVEEELAVERENKAGSSDALARKLEISEAKTSKKAEELQEARQEIQELEEELRERAGEVSTLRAQVKGAEGVRGNTETKLVELEAQLETAVISKANELRELKRELKREASECTAAKAELTELEEELRERSGEVSTLRAQIKGTEGKRGDAETKLVELETQLEAAVQSESNELRELKRELKKEASECAAAKAELEELEAQLESCAQSEATEIRELKEELRKESSECKAVKGELEELEAQLEACAQSEAAEMRDLRMELERETSARRATKTELRELEAQLEAKEHEAVVIDELREELNREVSECKKVRAELQELEQQLGMSKEMDLQLREELVNKTSECAAAKTELQEIHKLLKNTQSETTELHKLKSELSNEANEREVAQTQLEASAGEIREKLQEIEDLRQNLCDLKEAAEEPKSKLEEAETAVEDLRKKLEETEEKLASERANKGEHNVLVERLEASENRAERKARELGEARQEVEELEEELHESASEVNTLAEELKAAKDILKGRESEIQGLRREYTEAESGALDVEAVAAEKTQLEGMLEDALKKIATSETYIEELEKALEVSKVRKDELDELRDRLEEAVRVAEDEDREVGSVMRDRLSAKDKAHKDLQLELETTEQQRDQYREQAAEYQNKVTQLEGKLMELKLELDTSRENDPEEVQDLREKLLKETTKTDKLKQSLSDADSAIKELRMNLTEAATKRAADADAKTERRKLNETHLSIDQGDAQGETAKQLKDALLEIRVLEDELQESVCEMESLRGQIVGGGGTPEKSRIMDERDTMQLKVRQLEEELQEANNEVDDLKSQLTETEDALRDARSQRGDPSVEGIVQHDLAGKLRRSEAKIRSLDEENNKVTRQLDDLISRFKKTDEMLQRKQDECTALGEEVEALKHTDVNQQLDILTQQLMETEAKMEQFQQNSQEDLVQRLQTSERELRNELRQRPHEADVQAQIELANERVVDLETELSKASEEKQELEDEIARLHNHLENSDQLCDEKQGEINKLCADYETMRNEREMTSHGSTMSPPRTDREGDVQKLKETIKEQEAYIKMLEDPSEYRGVGYEAEQQEWKLRHDQLEDVVAELRGSLADAELQAETNNQTAEDYKTIAKEMTGKADIAEDACRDVAEQIALLKEDKEHLKTQMIAMKSQLGANRESDDSARVAALQAKLATSNELVAQLRKTIAEFKSKNMFLTIDKNQLVDRFAEAESKVTNLKDHAIALKQRLSVAKKESQQKEVEILQWKQKCDSVTNELSLIQSGSPTPIKHVHHSSHDSMLPLPVWEDGDQLKRRNDELQEMTDAYQQQLRVNTKLRQELEELEEKQVMAGQADNMSKEQSDALRNIAAILRSKTLELEADATAISELNDERSKVKADFKKMENLLRMERLSSREDEELLKSLKSAFELDTTKLDNKSVELKASIKRLQAAYAHVLNLVKNTDVKGDDKDIENAALKCVVQLVADQMKTKESKYRQLQDRFTEMAEFPHRNVSPQRSVSPRRCMEPGWGEVLTDVTDIFGKVQDLRPVTDPYGINEVEKLEEFCGGLVIKYSIGLNDLRDRPADPNCDRNHSESCPVPGRISPRPPRDYPTTPTIHTIAATAAYPRDPPPSQTSPPSLNRLVSMAF